MKIFFKNVSKSLFALLMMLCLLAATGCSADGSGNREAAVVLENRNAKVQVEEEETESADTEVSAFSLNKNTQAGPGDLMVQFLDVGQGSATLIRQRGGTMLVDGGDRETSSFLVSFLKEQGITSLDYVVVSHYDSDHLAGVIGVLNAFECDMVLAPDYEGDTKLYESFWSTVEEKEIPVIHPKLGDTFSFAESSFRVVSPVSYEYKDANSNSLGIRLEYGENSFLLCGDCTEESEQDMLYLDTSVESDVYAANHHGSKYSNSQEFLGAVSPEYVVISCGAGNSYGHPDASVLLEIQKLGAGLFRTDLQGTVTAVSDGKKISFEQEICMDYRSGTEIAETGTPEAVKEKPSVDSGHDGIIGQNGAGSPEGQTQYILNTNTMKFHLPECGSAGDIADKNKKLSTDTRESIIDQGYTPCKRCNP